MIGKFLLFFFLARIMSPSQLGVFGLIVASVTYGLYFLGFDFYTYSGRSMLKANKDRWPSMLRDQGVLFACNYLVMLPLFSVLFVLEILPIQYLVPIYALLVVEHVSLEFVRLLVVIGKPVAAGVVIFMRSGAWCYFLIATYLLGYTNIDMSFVLWSWIVAELVGIVIGGAYLYHLPWELTSRSVDWAWLRKGLSVASVFLLGTLSLRGIFVFDRYFIEYYESLQMVGVYTLYIGICNSLIGFVDAAVFSFKYPNLVSTSKSFPKSDYENACREFRYQTVAVTFALAVAAAIFIVPVVGWIGKPEYLKELSFFYALLAVVSLYVISHIPHYQLYALGDDKFIVGSHFISLCVFLFLGFVLGPVYGVNGIVFALFVSVGFMGVAKSLRVMHMNRLRSLST